MSKITLLKDELTGALVGLSRVCSNNPKTENTDSIIVNGLVAASGYKSLSEEELKGLIDKVNVEKYLISPGCATCAAKCGNTDNFEMGKLWNAEDDIKSLKLMILVGIEKIAVSIKDEDFSKTEFADMIFVMYKGLYVMAENWKSKDYLEVIQEVANSICKCREI